MSAIVGIAGLPTSLNTVKQGAVLALANKESLVAAGPLLMSEAAKNDAKIIPVDSEHSAIFQALLGEDINTVERIIITASGGAFRDLSQNDLKCLPKSGGRKSRKARKARKARKSRKSRK